MLIDVFSKSRRADDDPRDPQGLQPCPDGACMIRGPDDNQPELPKEFDNSRPHVFRVPKQLTVLRSFDRMHDIDHGAAWQNMNKRGMADEMECGRAMTRLQCCEHRKGQYRIAE
jgi:hypothetical protein